MLKVFLPRGKLEVIKMVEKKLNAYTIIALKEPKY